MRGFLAFAWAFSLGYYVHATHLDRELAELGREAYDATVLHTAAVLKRAEIRRPAAPEEVLS